MAQIVIFLDDRTAWINARKATHLREARKKWTRGDIVQNFDDGVEIRVRGVLIGDNARYGVLDLIGNSGETITAEQVDGRLEPDVDLVEVEPGVFDEDVVQRRRVRLDFSVPPLAWRDAFIANRRGTLTTAQFNNWMRTRPRVSA